MAAIATIIVASPAQIEPPGLISHRLVLRGGVGHAFTLGSDIGAVEFQPSNGLTLGKLKRNRKKARRRLRADR
jgi:hypothetical protein